MIASGQTSGASTQRKIVISINKSARKSRPSVQDSGTVFNPDKQLPKLIEISERCFDYYDKFKDDRLQQQQYTQTTFNQVLNNLNETFKQLYHAISIKEKQLKKYIMDKKKQFLSFHPLHFLSLTSQIEAIKQQKSFYEKLTFPLSSNNIFQTKYSTNGSLKQSDVSQFAKLLNQFYTQIESIEKISYKQKVQQSISNIKNLIQQQKNGILYVHKERSVVSESNKKVMKYDNDQLFSIKQFEEVCPYEYWEQYKVNTERSQKEIDINIERYLKKMSVF